jgi:hypothetical protein
MRRLGKMGIRIDSVPLAKQPKKPLRRETDSAAAGEFSEAANSGLTT